MIRPQTLVLSISILASFVAFLDSSVVNVALPAISRDLGGGLITQQWVVDAYLITLGSLILLAGSLSDLFGRQRILFAGLVGFAVASILCAAAPSDVFLIIARALQGIAGALLVPSSLAIIMSSFSSKEQGKAIGTWTAWTGIAFVIGPLLGGFLVDSVSWRLIFAINIVPIAVCLWLLKSLDQPDHRSNTRIDSVGALLCSLGLSGTVFGHIEQSQYGWGSPLIFIPLVCGSVALVTFVFYENRKSEAMLPLVLFKVRNFSAGNLATVAIYAGLSVATFLIVIFLQQVSKYSALEAGLALLPVTIIMFFLSPRFGKLASIYGPRLFMSVGPFTAGLGFLLMLRVSAHINYWSQLLPGILVFALGLSMTVAPLTTAVLSDVEKIHSGIASAVNNAVSRIAGLIAIALIGIVTGPHLNLKGFHKAILLTGAVVILGGVIAYLGIRNPNKNLSLNK
jgi:EmrB/QacA subfamily drug resistance transporter